MCKFSLHDTVRVTNPNEHHYDELGVITDHDPDLILAGDASYRVKFSTGLNGYFTANDLTLGDNE